MSRPTDERIGPGTVTAMTVQARRADRLSVHLDGEFAFSLPAEFAARLDLRIGTRLDEAEAERLRGELDRYEAKRHALALLARRSRSEFELRRALLDRGHDPGAVDEAVGRMRELGYVDDAAFARTFAAARARARGHGRRRILGDLRRRGIPDAEARAAVQEIGGEPGAEIDRAVATARRAWERYAREADPRRRAARLYGYLARRGFDPDTIARALDRLERGAVHGDG